MHKKKYFLNTKLIFILLLAHFIHCKTPYSRFFCILTAVIYHAIRELIWVYKYGKEFFMRWIGLDSGYRHQHWLNFFSCWDQNKLKLLDSKNHISNKYRKQSEHVSNGQQWQSNEHLIPTIYFTHSLFPLRTSTLFFFSFLVCIPVLHLTFEVSFFSSGNVLLKE